MIPDIRFVAFDPVRHQESDRHPVWRDYVAVYPGSPEWENAPFGVRFITQKEFEVQVPNLLARAVFRVVGNSVESEDRDKFFKRLLSTDSAVS